MKQKKIEKERRDREELGPQVVSNRKHAEIIDLMEDCSMQLQRYVIDNFDTNKDLFNCDNQNYKSKSCPYMGYWNGDEYGEEEDYGNEYYHESCNLN